MSPSLADIDELIRARPDYPQILARRQKRRSARHSRIKPFIGVDGEGGGTDPLGRQNYLLLRAGAAELFDDNRPLRTVDCLEFLLAQPPDVILAGYYFTYDATMILRDLPEERLRHLLREPERSFRSPYTFWGGYALQFRPRQYFRVARAAHMRVAAGTARTVNEVGGFFQRSFVSALSNWGVGTDAERLLIGETKLLRDQFVRMTARERDYCALECRLLAELMELFRAMCQQANIVPKAWRGAGWISAALHAAHATPRRKERVRAKRLDIIGMAAYFGGRFEIVVTGRIPGPVFEHDINSAYPAAMLRLPCPLHTKWRMFRGAPPTAELWGGKVSFTHGDISLCGLPIRQKGRLFWPREGSGTYWSPEINAAERAGCQIVSHYGGWHATRECDCAPFAWVAELYEERRRIGKAQRGYPIKLGLNGLYGKLAQRQGAAPWRDYVLAGLITAYVRSWLIDAYASAPADVVMIATDALLTRRAPLRTVEFGTGLGQWELKERPTGMFVVQPGIYWSPGSDIEPKTRGIPTSRIIAERETFERVWAEWCSGVSRETSPPSVLVELTSFIGHRLALARNKPEQAGQWRRADKNVSFDWSAKRRSDADRMGEMMLTRTHFGWLGLESEDYDPVAITELQEQLLEDEAEPDFIPWGNSGE